MSAAGHSPARQAPCDSRNMPHHASGPRYPSRNRSATLKRQPRERLASAQHVLEQALEPRVPALRQSGRDVDAFLLARVEVDVEAIRLEDLEVEVFVLDFIAAEVLRSGGRAAERTGDDDHRDERGRVPFGDTCRPPKVDDINGVSPRAPCACVRPTVEPCRRLNRRMANWCLAGSTAQAAADLRARQGRAGTRP